MVLTLRYLATGCSHQTLSYSFQIGRTTTVSNIIKDVCDVIYTVLSPFYLRPSRQKCGRIWLKISDDFEELLGPPSCNRCN